MLKKLRYCLLDLRYYRKRTSRRQRLVVHALFFAVFLVGIFLLFSALDAQIKDNSRDIFLSKSRSAVTDAVSAAVREKVVSGEASYHRIMIPTTDGNGRIIALEADIAAVSALRTALSDRISALLDTAEIYAAIPVGNLTGADFLHGRGTPMRFRITSEGGVETNIRDEFVTAGINQTSHTLYLDVKASMCLLLPSGAETVVVETSIVLAQTVIVGEVPEILHGAETLG